LTSALATRVLTGLVLVAAVLAALFLLPPAGWAVVALAIVAIGAHEWAKLIGFTGTPALAFTGTVVVAGLAVLATSSEGAPSPALVVGICGVATLWWMAIGAPSVLKGRQPASPFVLAACGFIVLLGAYTAIVALQSRSPWLALAAMAIVWIADTAAYFVGRRFGRRKLAPRISPGKTWEGACGGIAAVVIYALALLPFAAAAGLERPLDGSAIALWIAFSIALAALSIVGDLFESLLKRRAGVKDSGSLLPGHGGVLDRSDALLAALPPGALAATVVLRG
jgi:phosphatidate cytidylyltransferase